MDNNHNIWMFMDIRGVISIKCNDIMNKYENNSMDHCGMFNSLGLIMSKTCESCGATESSNIMLIIIYKHNNNV